MTQIKGQTYSTGTVHYAKASGIVAGQIVQSCGFRAGATGQREFLAPVGAEVEVTCRRCLAGDGRKPAAKPAPERRVFGRQEWTITDLRDVAKELKIAGRSKMTGDELLAEIVKHAPQFG